MRAGNNSVDAPREAVTQIPGKISFSRRFSGRVLTVARSYYLLVILSLIWGMAFVAIKVVEPMLSPVNLTLLRWLLASAGLIALSPFLGKSGRRFERHDIPRFLMVSFANVVAYHLTLNYSESSISAGLAVLLVAMGPVFIVLLSSMFLKERHGRDIIYIVGLAITGSVVLSIGSGVLSGGNTLSGVLEAVGTALSYSVFAVFSKPLVSKYGARPFAIWTGLTGTGMLLPLILAGGFVQQVSDLGLVGWGAMLYLSILSTVVGYMLFYTLVGRGAVSRLSIQLYLIPVVGVAGGALLLGEAVTSYTVAGGIALLTAVGLATRSGRRRA